MIDKILPFIFLFLCIESVSQSVSSYYFMLSPNYSYRTYKQTYHSKPTSSGRSGNEIYNQFKTYYGEREAPQVGFSTSLGLLIEPFENFKIRTGLTYKNLFEQVSVPIPEGVYQYDGQVDFFYSSNPKYKKFKNSYQYFGLLATVSRDFIKKGKFALEIEIGFEVDYLIGGTIKNHQINTSTFSTQSDYKYLYSNPVEVALNARGGLLLEYRISEQLHLFLSPQFARYLTPSVKYDIEFDEDYYSYIHQYNYFSEMQIGLILTAINSH